MIRLTLLWLVVLGIFGYTWKDWYRGLCGLIVLMAIIEHPDMPKSILGIPGLNPWNLLLGNIVFAWINQRKAEGLRWDLPRGVTILLVLYLGLVLVGFARIIGDTSILTLYYREGMTYFINEYLINTVKWVIPALLLYDGCRTEERFRLAVLSILSVFVLLGIQVAKWMPPTVALNTELLERRSLKVLVSGIGYHRVNLSAMLSGASWAILCTTVLVPKGKRWMVVLTALFVVYAQMMTGGRAGYGAWVAVGLIMCCLKWRRYLTIIPVAAVLAMWLLPGVVGRATEGFTAESRDTNTRLDAERPRTIVDPSSQVDAYTVTAGRSVAWPLIIDGIRRHPWVGYGRQAMLRTGIATYLYDNFGELFPHPHNAYLELLLDNGIVGAVIVLPFYALMLFYSIRLFLDRDSPSCSAAGGVSTALLLGLLISGMGSQTFYPREGWMGMWAAMFLALRVKTLRERKPAEAAGAQPAPVAAKTGLRRPSPVPVFARPLGPVPAMRAPLATAQPSQTRPVAAGPLRPLRTGNGSSGPLVKGSVGRNAGGAQPARPAPLETETPVASGRLRKIKTRLRSGIQHSGFFGSSVTDPLVWEQA